MQERPMILTRLSRQMKKQGVIGIPDQPLAFFSSGHKKGWRYHPSRIPPHCGRRLMSSMAAVSRFFAAVTAADQKLQAAMMRKSFRRTWSTLKVPASARERQLAEQRTSAQRPDLIKKKGGSDL